MGLGSTLSTAISGLNVNQLAIDTVGNNLANSNTTAFKSARSEFANSFLNTLQIGSAPGTAGAGTNPQQIGQGSRVSSVAIDFRPGASSNTGVPTDFYIQGDGFFIVENGTELLYTRDGSFRVDSNFNLTTPTGLAVQGYGIDENFEIQTTGDISSLENIRIPLGELSVAEQTTMAELRGQLNSSGPVSTQATIVESQAIAGGGLGTALSALTVGGQPIFDNGAGAFPATPFQVTYTANKGDRDLPPATMTITAATTLQEFASFINGSLGINTGDTTGGNTPGIAIGPGGGLQFTGNFGTESDFEISAADFDVTAGRLNLNFNKSQTADGESAFSQFTVFDSLGNGIEVRGTAYLVSAGNEQSVFNVLLESPDQTLDAAGLPPGYASTFDRDIPQTLSLTFNAQGQLVPSLVNGNPVSIVRQVDNPASQPFEFEIEFGGVSALAFAQSELESGEQDGSAPGLLIDWGVSPDGTIQGAFSNGLTRPLGQVVLAKFNNPQGLIFREDNLYQQGVNSGVATASTPGDGVGTVIGGSLELSNVDIAVSFVELLTSSTAFNANSRVIATTQDLFNTLLQLPRS